MEFVNKQDREAMNKWENWLANQRKKSGMTVEEISLMSVDKPWGIQETGNYGRIPEAFFNIVGAKIQADREVPAWSQPIIKEFGKGVVALVKSKIEEGDTKFLLTARQEPGNSADKSYILLGPTIQASESNMSQAHGGKRPPFAELLDKCGNSVTWTELPQDGGKFLNKTNKYAVVEIIAEEAKKIVLPSNVRWFRESEIQAAFFKGEINEHLLQALMLHTMSFDSKIIP